MVAHRLPDRVGVVEVSTDDSETVYVAPLPDGPIVVLRDTALTIWREAVQPTSPLPLAERVAATYGVPTSEVLAAVEACVADLARRGVLEVRQA